MCSREPSRTASRSSTMPPPPSMPMRAVSRRCLKVARPLRKNSRARCFSSVQGRDLIPDPVAARPGDLTECTHLRWCACCEHLDRNEGHRQLSAKVNVEVRRWRILNCVVSRSRSPVCREVLLHSKKADGHPIPGEFLDVRAGHRLTQSANRDGRTGNRDAPICRARGRSRTIRSQPRSALRPPCPPIFLPLRPSTQHLLDG
jgi:hypothetical protein